MAKILGMNTGSLIRSGASIATSVLSATGDKLLGKVTSKITHLTSDPVVSKITSQGWRNALFIARALSNKNKDLSTGPDPAKGHISTLGKPDPTKTQGYSDPDNPQGGYTGNIQIHGKSRANRRRAVLDVYTVDPAKGQRYSDKQEKRSTKIQDTNRVIIYNISRSPYEYIILQNRPQEIVNQSQTSWAEIKSMGRNLPMFHYLGGQDEIHLDISWFCNDPEHPEEVLVKCQLLESWTKSNGYQAAPPVLRIQWGTSDIFKDQYFILTSATYTLGNFRSINRNFRDNPEGVITDSKLYPGSATQELIFKRISATNPSQQDYVSLETAKGINGIVANNEPNQYSIPNT